MRESKQAEGRVPWRKAAGTGIGAGRHSVIDSTHTYDGTKRELALLDRKIRENGIVLGDDWQTNRNHRHHGVALAICEFLRTSDFEPVLCGVFGQWILRRRLKNNTDLPILWEDCIYGAGNERAVGHAVVRPSPSRIA